MKFIVCIDINNGLMFNNRRVSKDEAVLLDIKENVKKISMNEYSNKMFVDYNLEDNVVVSDEFGDDYYFVENNDLCQYQDKITHLIIYNWNRDYPSDLKLELNLKEFNIVEENIIEGNSHPEIIKRLYVRRGC